MENKKPKDYESVMKRIKDSIIKGEIKGIDDYAHGSHRINRFSDIDEMTDEEIYDSINIPNKEETKFTYSQKIKLIELLKKVQNIQNSNLNNSEKVSKIKHELWTKHNPKTKLLIGAFLGTIFGFAIFGTGGIGIAALGGATGIWGFLAGTTGGILVSSLIQNFEK